MAGFFGLFGSKTKYVDEEGQGKDRQQPKEDFYLSPDDAKTYGDIDYMRTAKKVRRTFPKTKSNQNTENIIEVSSIKEEAATKNSVTSQPAVKSQSQPQPVASSETTAQPTQEKTPSVEERRRVDTSMDMFLNMARQIKK